MSVNLLLNGTVAYSWEEIYVSNLQFLLKLALWAQIFLHVNLSHMHLLCLYGLRKSKPRLKSELRKQQYTVTLFDCNHLAHAAVLWQMQKFMCYCTVSALF